MLSRYIGLAVAIAAAASVATCASRRRPNARASRRLPDTSSRPSSPATSSAARKRGLLQDDDLENPGFLAVERAADAWKKVEGGEGKSCMSCHGEAETSMKGVGAAVPKWDDKLKKPVNLEQHINNCRSEHMKAEP